MALKSIWKKWAETGITTKLPAREQKAIGLINRYCILMAFLLVPTLIFSVSSFRVFLIAINSISIAVCLFILWLNHKQQFSYSKHLFLIMGLGITLFGNMVFPRENGSMIYFVLSVIMPVLVFKAKRWMWFYYTLTVGLFAFTIYWQSNFEPLMQSRDAKDVLYAFYFNYFTVVFLVLFAILRFFNSLNDIYEHTLLEKNQRLEVQKEKIQNQKQKLEQSHRQITDSINYANRIQQAVLPEKNVLYSTPFAPVLFLQARDVVSGDFYWIKQLHKQYVFVAADCTGHGVPGAFMSMLGMAFLNEIVSKNTQKKQEVKQQQHTSTGIYYEYVEVHDNLPLKASEILEKLRQLVKTSLKQTGKANEPKDGMDVALCVIDAETLECQFAGANNPLYVIRSKNGQPLQLHEGEKQLKTTENENFILTEIKANRNPIGIYRKEKEFQNLTFQLYEGDVLYMFSDGLPDQIGGPKGKKFKYKPFRELLLKIHTEPAEKQQTILKETIADWMGEKYAQVDDMLVFGIKI